MNIQYSLMKLDNYQHQVKKRLKNFRFLSLMNLIELNLFATKIRKWFLYATAVAGIYLLMH